MKKLLLVITLILPMSLFAQRGTTYGAGVWNFSLGAGFPNTTHTSINASTTLLKVNGAEKGSSTPFFMASASYGLIDDIEVGVFGGYFQSESEIVAVASALSTFLGGQQDYGKTKYQVFTLGGKLTYHRQLFPDLPKLDLYASTYLGWNFVKDETSIDLGDNAMVEVPLLGEVDLNNAATTLVKKVNYPKVSYEVNVGGKYAITDNWSIYGEAGYGRFLVNAGVTYSIPFKGKKKAE